jgi:hypothetical protein
MITPIQKPGKVIAQVNKKSQTKLNHTDHKHILAVFKIRPYKKFGEDQDPFDTNPKYCHYDEAHNDYLYQECWVDFLVSNLTTGQLKKEFWKKHYDDRKVLDVKKFEQQ